MFKFMLDGGSPLLFEPIPESDLGGKSEVMHDDLGSPTPKKASLLETIPPQGDERIPHARSHPRRQNVPDFGWRGETLLRWRMVVVLWGRLWEPSPVDRHGTLQSGTIFCNAVGVLAISVRIGVDITDNVNILPSNTRATQAVLQIDPIDGGARAGNGEGNKDQPSPGAVFRDDNRVLPVEQKAVTHEN